MLYFLWLTTCFHEKSHPEFQPIRKGLAFHLLAYDRLPVNSPFFINCPGKFKKSLENWFFFFISIFQSLDFLVWWTSGLAKVLKD